MTVISPFEVAATGIITAFNAEFQPEGFVMVPDKLHESRGKRRVDVAVSPLRDTLMANNSVVQETYLFVQFYDIWDERIDPDTQVNPFAITSYAERFRQAVQRSQVEYEGSSQVWYFDVQSIEYPDDPTSNKTRFEAQVRAYGNNAGLIETSA
jgi:hypothetical protein